MRKQPLTGFDCSCLALLTEPVLECLAQEDSSIRILSTIERSVFTGIEDPHLFEEIVFVGFESLFLFVGLVCLIDLVYPVDL